MVRTLRSLTLRPLLSHDNKFDQDDYDKDNSESANKASVYTGTSEVKKSNVKYSSALKDDDTNAPVTGAKLTPDTLYAYEKDGSDYTLFVLTRTTSSVTLRFWLLVRMSTITIRMRPSTRWKPKMAHPST